MAIFIGTRLHINLRIIEHMFGETQRFYPSLYYTTTTLTKMISKPSNSNTGSLQGNPIQMLSFFSTLVHSPSAMHHPPPWFAFLFKKMYVIATCQGEYIFDLTPSSHHIFVKVSTPPYAPQLCQSMKLIAALSVEIILNSVLYHSESSAFNYHLFHLSELIITMIFQDLDFSRCVQ